MARIGICPTCGNFDQELDERIEVVTEVLEMVDFPVRELNGVVNVIRSERPIHYPTSRRDKRGPRHKIISLYCPLGHFITTEDSPE